MNIFVGNLSFDVNESDVKRLFEGFGNVVSAVIVMSKDKKTPKSRGFGFVQMPDEQQALAAIDALNGKEFMGRELNVNPGRSKAEVLRESKLKKKKPVKSGTKRGKTWFSPVFDKHPALKDEREEAHPSGRPGGYRGGMLTRSYKSRRGLDGMQGEAKPWKKSAGGAKPWQKSPGEHKPWQKTGGEVRPWKKAEGAGKPWRKPEGGIKPWRRPAGEAKPWSKPAGEAKPWRKPEGGIKPWRKPAGEAKPWKKSSESSQKPRFNKGRSKAGGHKP